MDLLPAHRSAMREFDSRVRQIDANQWNDSTPCTEWTVRDLLNHLVGEQLWAPWLLRGATLDEVGDRFDGDQLGSDPQATWAEASTAARTAWDALEAIRGEVHVTGGTIPTEDYGWQMILDLTVHAWDLARGIDTDETLASELVETVYEVFAPSIESLQGLGIFAPPRRIDENADMQSRLLALLGRAP
ncbi:TIGR03086 family metal-binding protein [Haloactinomyces albus]|uniref:Uncharacterized protein (TIGR03086 family) n=1 Tax=Haloactinomyces albus TaxID=1352928 RepID=A0AAE4CLN5_9ACTN|nr:TIGR03086 family metal-binding protein [Haloactinomyces albus]MDR7300117.1 uncharacterized protein (TIGR03086 family) [Haloactinomyces albus]